MEKRKNRRKGVISPVEFRRRYLLRESVGKQVNRYRHEYSRGDEADTPGKEKSSLRECRSSGRHL